MGRGAGRSVFLVLCCCICACVGDLNALMGIKGDGFVLVGGDKAFFRGLVVMGANATKVQILGENVLAAAVGDPGDVDSFMKKLQRVAGQSKVEPPGVSARALAQVARRDLSLNLRKTPRDVNLLLAGWDNMRGPQLYWIDKMGALQEVPFGAHGHASRFVLSVLDTCCTDVDGNSFNLSLEEAVDAMRACVEQLEKRFAINSQGFSMQVVDRDGCRSLPFERN